MPGALVLSCGMGGAGLSAHASSIIIPDGLNPGDTFQLAFVTSERIAAQSSNVNVYNTFVATAAAAAGLNVIDGQAVTWTAMVSTPHVDARDNAPSIAPVYNLQMQLVTMDAASLWEGFPVVMNNPISTTEFGTPPTTEYVWTGTDLNGQALPTFSLGANFLFASYGNSTSIFSSWIDSGVMGIRTKLPLYALSSPITVPTPGGGGGDQGGGTTGPGGGVVPEASTLRLGLLSLCTLAIGWLGERFGLRRRRRDAEDS